MATPINKNTLNQETNARFWATGYRPGHKLDPNNPTDKAMMPVWMDIFRKVQAEAAAGTLVTTYDRPEVAQRLADAEIANAVAAMHVDEAAKASDPAIAQQHTAAAATASQVSALKLSEAAANQPPTVSPKVVQDAAREAARTPPPPMAPAADHIAHAQTQTPPQNGQMLRPEQDPWDSRYVPTSKSPREQPPAQPPPPSREQPRGQPPQDVLIKETNVRFWNRTHYKPGLKLDMSIAEDRKQSKIWMEFFGEVQREAHEGRLTFTNPELAPSSNGSSSRPPSRPMPPPPSAMQPPQRPMPMQPPRMPDPWWPGMQQPMPPGMQQPMPPGMQQPMPPGMQQPMPPGMQQPMPPGMQQPMPPGMQQPMPPGMQQPMPPGMQRPMPPGMQRPMPPGMQQPMPPSMQPGMQPPMLPEAPLPTEGGQPPSFPTEGTTPSAPAGAGMSKGTIALIVLGLASAAGVAYVVTSKPAGRTVAFRPRAKSAAAAPMPAFSPSRGGRY